jgi:hypothetical protein
LIDDPCRPGHREDIRVLDRELEFQSLALVAVSRSWRAQESGAPVADYYRRVGLGAPGDPSCNRIGASATSADLRP